MNIGSLYQVKERFWLLFPTKEIVTRRAAEAGALIDAPITVGKNAAWYAARYSTKYNCNVTWFSPESFVVCLEEDGMLKKLLTSKGLIGWIQFNETWLGCFEEVKSE
jgi:hypothetical protein